MRMSCDGRMCSEGTMPPARRALMREHAGAVWCGVRSDQWKNLGKRVVLHRSHVGRRQLSIAMVNEACLVVVLHYREGLDSSFV